MSPKKRKTSPKRKTRKGNSKRLNPSPFTRYLNQWRNTLDIRAHPWIGFRHQTGYLDQDPYLSYYSRNYTPGEDSFFQGMNSGTNPTEIDFDLDIDELEAEVEAERQQRQQRRPGNISRREAERSRREAERSRREAERSRREAERSRREVNPCTRPGRYKCSECNDEQDPIFLDEIEKGICADNQCYDFDSLLESLERTGPELPHNRQRMSRVSLRQIQAGDDEC